MLSILALAVLAGHDLARNLREWMLLVASHYFPGEAYIEPKWLVDNNYTDQPYLNLILIGSAVMLASYSVLIVLLLWERKKAKTAP